MNRRNIIKTGLASATLIGLQIRNLFVGGNQAQAAEKPHKTTIKTLVIVSHPYPERSVMTKGMQAAAESIDRVTVRNLESLYGFDTRAIDADKEREITRAHDRIVFMFPTHWFNIAPMMAYLNDVWGSVGPGLWQGKEMLLVTTAAGEAARMARSGRIGVKLADVFLPMKASALRRHDLPATARL